MATISSLASPLPITTNFVFLTNPSKPTFQILKPTPFNNFPKLSNLHVNLNPRLPRRLFAVAEEAPAAPPSNPFSEAARRIYVGNIPRTVNHDELAKIVGEHGAVEKAEVMYDKYTGRSRRFGFVTMKTVEDANTAIEKLNGTQIGGREIKVNITEKPLASVDLSFLQLEESQFIDSPHKVYVGNLAKTVTSETLKKFFSDKGKVLSAKVSRVPGTSRSSGYGFVTFSEEGDVETAISSFNNSLLEGQTIRVNKA